MRAFEWNTVGYGGRITMRKAVMAWLVSMGPVFADPVTIVALGDSLTQGFGLPPEQSFVPQLQNWLDRNGAEAVLINAGVSGDTTAGGLSRVDWTLTPEVDAMIVALGGNDLLRGIDPATTRANLDGILKAAAAAEVDVLLVGMQAPGNFGPDFKQSFDAIYPDLASQYDTLYMESFFQGMGTDDLVAARDLFQNDRIHPNAAGVIRIVDGFGPHVIDLIARAQE